MLDLNNVLVLSIAVLAFFSFCIFIILIPVVYQLLKTLSAFQHMLDTVNSFDSDVRELKENVSKVKGIVRKSTSLFDSVFKNIGVFLISSAYGMAVGVKEYFSPYKTTNNIYDGKGACKKEINTKGSELIDPKD